MMCACIPPLVSSIPFYVFVLTCDRKDLPGSSAVHILTYCKRKILQVFVEPFVCTVDIFIISLSA